MRRSREYVAAARAAGDRDTALVEVEGGGHRGVIDPGLEGWRAAVSWLADRPGGAALDDAA